MQQTPDRRYCSGLRIFSACLLSWLIIFVPLVPIAAASRPDRGRVSPVSPTTTENTAASPAERVVLNAPVPQPAPEPLPLAPVITATKDDGLAAASAVAPGGNITYTVTINNNGAASPADDATGVIFTDQIDAHTTLVPGSPIAAGSDKYNTIGNVQISVPDGPTDLLGNDFDPDTGNNTGMTATAETKSSTNCTGGCSNNVTINSNGSFTYDPPVGFAGTDTFTYTANSGTDSITATVTITVANKIWFINNNAGACTSNCDGRLSHPFTSLAAFNAVNDGAPGHPSDNDWIFVFESSTAYTGPAILRTGQKFIGQDVTASLSSLTGFIQPSGTDPLPVTNPGNGTIVQITTSAASTNGINLFSNNTLRGFTVGNTTGAKISGNNFGTLLVGNSVSPDVTLNGSGQALNLSTGTLSVSGRFVSVTTTSSGTQGISLTGIADSDGAGGGSFLFGSTTVSGSTTQGILVGTTTADLNFGNTSVTGGTDAISLQNNSAGTRAFGTITTSGNSGVGFLHGAGGGAVSVIGATNITNPGGNGIDIDSSNANLSFAASTVSKNNSGIGVDLTNNATRTIGFTSLTVTTTTGFAINANNSGTVNVTTGSLTQSGAGGGAAQLTNTTLGMTFTSVSSDGGANGILLSGGSGSFSSGTTNLQNNAGIGLSMSSSAVNANFGNTTVNSSAGDAVDLSSNTNNITFAALNLAPDANLRGLDAQNNTGTITSTSGNIATTGAPAIFIDGPAGRTPLAMLLTNVDSTNSSTEGLNLTEVSGSFTVNDPGTATGIVNSTGTGILVNNSAAAVNFGNTSVTGSGNANGDDTGTGVFLTNNTGAVTFGSLTVTPDSGERGLFATDTDAATAAGLITIGSGTITTTNDVAVQVSGASAAARTPLNIQLTTVNTTGGATASNGIVLQNTSASGSPGGFRVLGNGGSCDAVTTTCTGGRITNTTGADGANGGNGILLNTVDKVVFTRMRLDNHPNFALRGFTVTGFVMDTCLVDGTNGNNAAFSEGSVIIDGLFGTAAGSNSNLITASTIKGGWGDNVRVTNTTSTAGELTIQNSTIRDTDTGTNGNDNIQINSHLNANLKIAITGSTFAATNGDHIQTIADGTSSLTIIITGNTFSGGGGVNALGQGITVSGGDVNGSVDSTETVRFDISNNTMNGTIQGGAINVNEGVGQGNWQGRVSSNIIGTAASNGSGASQSAGIRVENHSKGTLTVSVLSNQVRQWSTQGINLQAGDTSATGLTNGPLNVTVTGNLVANPNPLSAGDHGIQLNVGTQVGNNNTVCGDFLNNNSLGNAANGGVDYRLRQRMLTTVQLPGYTSGNSNNAQVRLYILGRPNIANQGSPNDVAASNNVAAGGGGFINTPGPGNPCAQPTIPTALAVVTAPDVVSQMLQTPQNEMADVLAVNTSQPDSDIANTPAVQPSSAANGPSFWIRTFTAVANFAGSVSSMIMPTAHAAELNDRTENANPVLETVQQPTKVVSHHAVLKQKPQKSEVMSRAAATNNALRAPMSGETVTANIGTLPAGGTVTIKYSVTVNNPPNLSLLGPPRVENQGTVTANGGISVLTDDPTVGGATDTTTTLIDLFNTTTSLASNLNPSNLGEQVTFTATVSESPAQGSADPTGTVDFIDTSNGNAVICDDVALSGGSAQCQTSALTAATHSIRADYSGDGNFDPSQSNVVAQVVNTCATNPVVTSTADSGANTLRDALANVCSGNTITFNIPGPGPDTITLTTGELVLAKNVTIRNNASKSLTISGNNASRVFNINSGKTAAIIGLTISGGAALSGGGILNDGTLTIVNSTVTGNNATGDGGAISTSASATGLTLINTTISGNNANGSAGGVLVLGGTMTSINSTITNNRADNDNNGTGTGGGIGAQAGTTTLKNTIVAGNFNEDGASDAADEIGGTVDATSSSNLIGTGGAGGLTNGVNNNQVGVATPGLGPLASNGGTTQTHVLLLTSPAIGTGSNGNLPIDTFDLDGDANTGETLPVDQRGAGFPRVVGVTVDIGALEANYTITPTAGTPQSTMVGTAFATNLRATVTESGNPVSGLSVTFAAPASGASGTFASTSNNTDTVMTDVNGAATASQFTANTIAGSYSVTATASGVPGSATFNLTNTAGPATHFVVSAPASAAAGSAFSFTVTALDQFNNTVTSYAGTVHFTSTDGNATLPADSTLTNGVGTFSATLRTAGNQTITATDTANAAINGASNTIAVSAAAATHFAVSAPASATAGSAFSFTVTALDQFNNTATSYAGTVHFASSDGAAVLPANSTLTNGVGTFSATLKTAGNQTITATDTANAGISGTSNTIAVSAGAATHFAVSAPNSAPAGAAFGSNVAALDQFDNTVTSYSGTVHFTSTDGNATLPADSTLTNGVGTFSATLRTAGNQTITATDTSNGSITGTSITISVSAGAATHFAVSAPGNVAINIAFNFTVTAQDQFNNTATNYAGTVHFTSTDGTAVLPANSTLTNGVGTFSATLNTAGNQTISATDTVTPSINGTSNTIVVGQLPITIHNAQVAEPAAGSVNMVFTVTLSAPAGASGVSVNFTTQDEAPALNHATAGEDYTATSGTLNFTLGEQLKTISVPILSDTKLSESNETFLVVLSNPVNGTLANGIATGTILITNQPGAVLISELRTSGPAGDGDDFVEVYNNSDSPLTVNASDGSAGYGLFKMGANCGAAPVLIGTIPNGTVIPARGHYLLVGSQYSLANYGGTGAAAGDLVLSADIESDANIGIFSTTNVVNLSTLNALDGVGFGSNTGGSCDLLREGSNLPPVGGSPLQYSFQRDPCGKGGNPLIFGGCNTQFPVDKNNNATDFLFADTLATITPAGQRLGAPGPENLASPRLLNSLGTALIDSTAPAGGTPNRGRDFNPVPNGAFGTLSVRRRFVNNTGAPITRLRFRIVDISSAPVPPGIADVRAITSSSVIVGGINDPATCLAANGSPTTPCTITVQGTTLEQPPTQPIGGGINGSLSAGAITVPTPLAPGASISVQLLLGVQVSGSFKFYLNIEALP